MSTSDGVFWDRVAPPELSADQREGVLMARGMFLAYVAAGFTPEQAMDLLKAHIAAAGNGR